MHPQRVRRRDLLPGPPPRGERQPARTSCRPCSSSTTTTACSSARSDRFLASLADARRRRVPAPHRPRTGCTAAARRSRRAPSPTRPTPTRRSPANREWGARHPGRAAATRSSASTTIAAAAGRPTTGRGSTSVVATARRGRRRGGASPAPSGARVLRPRRRRARGRAAAELDRGHGRRDRQDHRPRPTPRSARPIDFAHYYAELARELDARRRRRVRAGRALTVVTPPWNFPVAIPAGVGARRARRRQRPSCIKPARAGASAAARSWPRRSGRPACPRDAARPRRRRRGATSARQLDRAPARRPGHPHRRVRDRRAVPLVPARPAAARRDQRQERHHRHARAPTSTSPSPDVVDARVRARRAEVLGRVAGDPGRLGRARRERFRGQLVDAVTSLTRRLPARPATQMGPIIEPAAAASSLTRPDRRSATGERWLVEPRQLDDDRPALVARRPRRASQPGSDVPPAPSTSARCSAS